MFCSRLFGGVSVLVTTSRRCGLFLRCISAPGGAGMFGRGSSGSHSESGGPSTRSSHATAGGVPRDGRRLALAAAPGPIAGATSSEPEDPRLTDVSTAELLKEGKPYVYGLLTTDREAGESDPGPGQRPADAAAPRCDMPKGLLAADRERADCWLLEACGDGLFCVEAGDKPLLRPAARPSSRAPAPARHLPPLLRPGKQRPLEFRTVGLVLAGDESS